MNARDKLFEVIDRQVRRPVVAQIGGFHPPEGLNSWFGGNFYLPEDTPWPCSEQTPLIPLVQIVTAEIPSVPSELKDCDVLQVFIGEELPVSTPSFESSSFAVLTHRSRFLKPREAPLRSSSPRSMPIRWSLGQPEGPCWEEADRFVDHELTMEFVKDDDCFEAYSDRYGPMAATKVGGWPSYIQGSPEDPGEFVLQIDSEEKANWMVGDVGTLYIYKSGADWGLHWDCC